MNRNLTYVKSVILSGEKCCETRKIEPIVIYLESIIVEMGEDNLHVNVYL